MDLKLVEIQENDYNFIKEVYDYYILNSTATFHTEKISIRELKDTIPLAHPKYKSFLIYKDEILCGYSYISQYKKRQAYDRTAEITIYLKPGFTGQGIGKHVINELGKIARDSGICVLIGIITGENLPSIRLFEKCAHFKKVGKKFNKILDVVTYQKIINEKLPKTYKLDRYTYRVDSNKYDLDIPIPIMDRWHWSKNKSEFEYIDF